MKIDRLPVLVACVLLVLGPFLPTLVSASVTAHDFARMLEVALLLVATLAILPAPIPHVGAWTIGLFALLFLLVSLSVASAAVPTAAWREVSLFAGLGSWAWMVARSSDDVGARFWLLTVCVSQVLYGLAFTGLLVAALANHQPVLLWEMSFGYDNPRFLNHVQAAVLPLLLGIAARPGASRAMRIMAALALTLQLFVLCASLGRSTMLGLLIATLVVSIVAGRGARRWLGIGLAATILAVAAYGALQAGVTNVQQSTGYVPTAKELTSDHSRQYLWDIALSDVRLAPWLGIGPMHYAHEINAKAAHPHNHYLQAAAELGWPALSILVLIVLRALWAMACALRAETDADRRAIGCGLLGAGIAVVVDACFSGNLVMPFSQIWIFAVIGLSCGWYRSRRHFGIAAPSSVASRLAWKGLRLFLLLSSLWLCAVSFKEIQAPTPYLQVEGGKTPSPREAARPRFWSYGWF